MVLVLPETLHSNFKQEDSPLTVLKCWLKKFSMTCLESSNFLSRGILKSSRTVWAVRPEFILNWLKHQHPVAACSWHGCQDFPRLSIVKKWIPQELPIIECTTLSSFMILRRWKYNKNMQAKKVQHVGWFLYLVSENSINNLFKYVRQRYRKHDE